MSSQPGEHPSRAPHGHEKGSKMQSLEHGDRRVEAHCNHSSSPGAVTSTTRDEGCRLSEAPGMRNTYGSLNAAQVSACRSCQHLYTGNSEVVLSPAQLEDHSPRRDPSNPRPISVHRPLAARKYEGLCDCRASVSGGECVCPSRGARGTLHGLCSGPCLRRVKVVALTLAAILPWVFLVTYIVLTYT